MKLIYPSAKGLARAFESIWNLVDEGVFKYGEEGVKFIGFDPSRSSMISFSLGKDSFLEYEIEKEVRIGMDMDYLKNIMKRARSNEMVKIEDSNGKVVISFETEKSKRTFTIPMLDIVEDVVFKEPNIEYTDYVKINAEVLKEIIRDASIISDYVMFMLTPDSFEVEVDSERGHLKEVFEKDSEEIEELKVENGAKSYHLLQYMDDIVKAAGKKETATLYLGNNVPLKLEYNIEKALARYYLIPTSKEY